MFAIKIPKSYTEIDKRGKEMYSLREAILSNCYIGSLPNYGDFTITQSAGYVVFNWPGGKTTRMSKAANGVDALIPLPDGQTLRIKMSTGLF